MEFDPRTEKNLATLSPKTQEKAREFMRRVIPAMKRHGVDVRIISGTRSFAEQQTIYDQGRITAGKIVTYARPGFSNHNFGIAFDIGLFKGTDYLENSPFYIECGDIGKAMGLEWGGDWKGKKQDQPHYQFKTGLSLEQMRHIVRKGEKIP